MIIGKNQIIQRQIKDLDLLCCFCFLVQWEVVKGFKQGTDRMGLVFLKQ